MIAPELLILRDAYLRRDETPRAATNCGHPECRDSDPDSDDTDDNDDGAQPQVHMCMLNKWKIPDAPQGYAWDTMDEAGKIVFITYMVERIRPKILCGATDPDVYAMWYCWEAEYILWKLKARNRRRHPQPQVPLRGWRRCDSTILLKDALLLVTSNKYGTLCPHLFREIEEEEARLKEEELQVPTCLTDNSCYGECVVPYTGNLGSWQDLQTCRIEAAARAILSLETGSDTQAHSFFYLESFGKLKAIWRRDDELYFGW
ncbi:hypothetical protein D9613_004364 [Agrocybe pediades]|uniref:Uncharacterized protein n=1 Tax=Agrocybe pediades TaxID=84607 RepID=A0A8H4VL19_9AGAR|nr:hypothetical protein D9613_004364 [Agrocybe pediades]